jgi:hypothetical protein
MSSYGMWRHVELFRSDILEEPFCSIFKVVRIRELGTTLGSN